MFSNLGKCLSFTVLAGGVASAILNSPAQAAIVKTDFAGLTVGSKTYNVEFWYDDDGFTMYNDVSTQLGSIDVADADEALVLAQAIVDQVAPSVFDPVVRNITSSLFLRDFYIPYDTSSSIAFRGGQEVRSNFSLINLQTSGGSFSPTVNVSGTFANLTEVTPVPTPALLPGLLGMGLATLRKRKLASSSQA